MHRLLFLASRAFLFRTCFVFIVCVCVFVVSLRMISKKYRHLSPRYVHLLMAAVVL